MTVDRRRRIAVCLLAACSLGAVTSCSANATTQSSGAGPSANASGDATGETGDEAIEGRAVPAAEVDTVRTTATSEVAVLAGGCFWGVQGVYQHVDGVTNAVSGYAGGEADTAHYGEVGTSTTGHAESVQVTFDPTKITYGEILQIYFSVAHDPTQLNRQGPDRGTQYRSTIFPTNDEQAAIAKAYIDQLGAAGTFDEPIVTTIEPGRTFYPAEKYHQDYLTLNPDAPYIVVNDAPKVAGLRHYFAARYRTDPVLVSEQPTPAS